MSFEEEFPSIKHAFITGAGERVVESDEVSETCVDKQRVREAIAKAALGVAAPDELMIEVERYLYRELGL